MTRRSFRYMAVALGVVALLGMSLVHFWILLLRLKATKKTRAVSPGKSTKADNMPSARCTQPTENQRPTLSFQAEPDGQELSEFGALHLHFSVYSRAARLIERS